MRGPILFIVFMLLAWGVGTAQIFNNDTYPAGTLSVEIDATEDTYLDGANKTQARTSDVRLQMVGSTTGSPKRPLLKFADLSDIPAGSAIIAAHLRCVTEKTSTSITGIYAHRMAIDWDDTATYATRDGSNPWTLAGASSWTAPWDATGAYAAADSLSDPTGDVVAERQGPSPGFFLATKAGMGNHAVYFDVTRMVRNWYSGEWTNYGLMLSYHDTTATGTAQIVSLEGTAGATPTLKVWYLPHSAAGTTRIGNGKSGVQ